MVCVCVCVRAVAHLLKLLDVLIDACTPVKPKYFHIQRTVQIMLLSYYVTSTRDDFSRSCV